MTEGGSTTAASTTTTTDAPAPTTVVGAGGAAGAVGATAMEVEEEGGFDEVQIEIDESEDESDDESDDDEGEGGSTRKGLSVDLDRPVAKGCFSLAKIGQIKAEWALRGAPTGYEALMAWPKNKVKELQPYGIILRKKEEGADVFYFFCLVSALTVKDIKVSKIATGSLDKINSSNAWRLLNSYGIYSQRGGTRKDNKEAFKKLARVARDSQLRAADSQLYFERLVTDVLHIHKLAPFAWAKDPSVRLMLKDVHEYYLDALPPEQQAALKLQFPGFDVERYHDDKARVRCELCCVALCLEM
jgi:hypothetical protein